MSARKGPLDRFAGDPRYLAAVLAGMARGSLVKTRQIYLRAHHGPQAVAELAGGLGAEAKDYLVKRPDERRWYPIAPLIELDRAILAGPMRGEVEQMRRFAREVATYDLNGVYKAFLRLAGSPGLVMRKLPEVFCEYFRPSRARLTVRGNPAIGTLSGGVLPYYLCEDGVPGWLEAAMPMAGARGFEVVQETCVHRGDPACTWRLRWD